MVLKFQGKKLQVSSITVIWLLLVAMWVGVFVVVPEENQVAGFTAHSGSTTTDETWTVAGNPHYITDDFTVSIGDVLTIDPGVIIRFDLGYRILVDGSLKANGTENNPIIFTSNESIPAIDDILEIRFTSNSNNNFIKYCECSYLDNGIRILTSSIIIQNSTIYNSTIGIRIQSGNPMVFNNTINSTTTGISISGGSPTLNDTTIYDTSTGISITGGSPTIYNNTINDTANGISIPSGSPSPTIYDNKLYNITDTGISVTGGSSIFYYNTINVSTSGAPGNGISVTGGTTTIYNNTFNISSSLSTATAILASGTSNIFNNSINASGSTAYGISTSGTSTIHDNIINATGSTAYGIYVSGGSPDISNNTIENSPIGIYTTTGSASIHHNNINGSTQKGIEVITGSAEIFYNNITNSNNVGIEVSGGSANIYQNNITTAEKGISVTGASTFTFNNNIIDSCNYGVWSEVGATIENCTITNTGIYDFYIYGGSTVVSTINTSYSKTNSIASGCELHKKWHVQIYVKDNFNNPMDSATIRITPQGQSMYQTQTAATGWKQWLVLTEYENYTSTSTPRTPHTIQVTAPGYNTTTITPTINQSRTLYITIQDMQPPLSSVSASKNWYNTSSVTLSYSASDNANLKNIKLYYNYSADNTSYSMVMETNSTSISGGSDSGSFIFDFINGSGYYNFYSRASDMRDIEETLTGADIFVGYDPLPPEFSSWEVTDITEDSTGNCRVDIIINDTLSWVNGLPTISYKYNALDAAWNGTDQQMILGSRASREEAIYYYNIPKPTEGWEYYQNKTIKWEITCSDIAGNSNITSDTTEYIDFVNHAPSAQLTPQPEKNDWYAGVVRLGLRALDDADIGDPEHGIASVEFQYSTDSTDGTTGTWQDCNGTYLDQKPNYHIYWDTKGLIGTNDLVWYRTWAIDNGGLSSAVLNNNIKIDNEPAVSSTDYDTNWHNADLQINITADDGDGSGVENIFYIIDDGTLAQNTNSGMPVITTESENNTLEYWSVDVKGNVEKHVNLEGIKLDKTKPSISGITITNITELSLSSDDIELAAKFTDPLSGLKNIPQFRIKLSGESAYGDWKFMTLVSGSTYQGTLSGITWSSHSGSELAFQLKCVDNADNQELVTSSELIDTTNKPPHIEHTLDPPIAFVGQDITITATVTDDQGVQNVMLYYKMEGDANYQTLELLRQSATSDVFTRDIPAVNEPGIMLYYIEASDNIYTITLPMDSIGSQFIIDIIEDADSDILPDNWEIQYFGDITSNNGSGDPDGDTLLNSEELTYGTDPTKDDSDNDDLPDNWEIEYGLNPLIDTGDDGADGDPDGDGIKNIDEYKEGKDPTKKDKKDEKTDDNTMMYAGIAIVIIVIILLLLFLILRGKGEIAGGLPGKEAEEDDEIEDEDEDDLVGKKLKGGGKGNGEVIKPPVKTMKTKNGRKGTEVIVIDKAILCGVCQGRMELGDKAVQCTCNLTSHPNCATEMKDCPQCGKPFDIEAEGITISEKDAKKVGKPMIRREVKREIEELVPPKTSYLTYVPEVSKEKDTNKFLSQYYDSKEVGSTAFNKDLENVDLFISVDAAKKMLDHCYEHGRKKEVMGLILGETYQHEDQLFSIAKDVATSELDATEVNVRFDSFDKLFAELDQLRYDYQILGWYHSHPNYTCFMSETDVDTQARMFKQPYQRAIVIDPIKKDMKAFALDKNGKNEVDEAGFAIIDFRD